MGAGTTCGRFSPACFCALRSRLAMPMPSSRKSRRLRISRAERRSQTPADAQEGLLQTIAGQRVEGAERLVEEHQPW